MLTVVRRSTATREKPPEVVRRASSRLPWVWDGLCFGVPFNEATRDSARDLVTGAAPSEWVGTPAWTVDHRGNVGLRLDSSSYIGYANNPTHNRPSTALTVYVRMRRAATPPTPPLGIFAKVAAEPDTFPWSTWNIQTFDADATRLAWHLYIAGATTYIENNAYTTDTSTWISVFLRWESGAIVWQDILGERGQLLARATSDTPLTGSLTYSGTPYPIRINARDNPTSEYDAVYSQAMVWSRRLTDVELQALVADPYGWYSPRRETVGVSSPYPLAFGGGEMRHGTGSGGLR